MKKYRKNIEMSALDITHFTRLRYNHSGISFIFSFITLAPYFPTCRKPRISRLEDSSSSLHLAKNARLTQAEISGLLLPNRIVSRPGNSWPLFCLICSCCCHSGLLWKWWPVVLADQHSWQSHHGFCIFLFTMCTFTLCMGPNVAIQEGRKDSNRSYSIEEFLIWGPQAPDFSL